MMAGKTQLMPSLTANSAWWRWQDGFDPSVVYLSSVSGKGLSNRRREAPERIRKQSPDIAGNVHVGERISALKLAILASCLVVA